MSFYCAQICISYYLFIHSLQNKRLDTQIDRQIEDR